MLIPTYGFGIEAGAGTAMSVAGAVATTNTVTVTFSGANPVLTGTTSSPSSWSITSSSPFPTTISNVQVVSNTVVLTTSETSASVSYTLYIPNPGIISSADGTQCVGPFTVVFSGSGTSPTILIIQVVDARTVNVVFSEAVNPFDALNENNYSANNGLQIIDVKQLGAAIFELTTSHQTVGTSYLITASNIRDLAGNVT